MSNAKDKKVKTKTVQVVATQVGEHPLGNWRKAGDKFEYDLVGDAKLPLWMAEADSPEAEEVAEEVVE